MFASESRCRIARDFGPFALMAAGCSEPLEDELERHRCNRVKAASVLVVPFGPFVDPSEISRIGNGGDFPADELSAAFKGYDVDDTGNIGRILIIIVEIEKMLLGRANRRP